jgi:hypothetical protein
MISVASQLTCNTVTHLHSSVPFPPSAAVSLYPSAVWLQVALKAMQKQLAATQLQLKAAEEAAATVTAATSIQQQQHPIMESAPAVMARDAAGSQQKLLQLEGALRQVGRALFEACSLWQLSTVT